MFSDLLWFLFSLHNTALSSTVLYVQYSIACTVQYCMYSTVLYVQHFTILYFTILLWSILSGLLSLIKCLYSQNKKRYWNLAALFCFSNYFDVREKTRQHKSEKNDEVRDCEVLYIQYCTVHTILYIQDCTVQCIIVQNQRRSKNICIQTAYQTTSS